MDHAEVGELLELAAVEPGGLERLTAGDTPEAAAVAGHVAGCPDCASELDRLRRDAAILRDVVRSLPPPELRERTLALVAAVGRDRPVASASGAGERVAAGLPAPLRPLAGRRQPRPGLWVAAIAAVLVVAVAGTALIVGSSRDLLVATQSGQIAALSRVAAATVRIGGEPDARRVELVATGNAAATATVLFSPSSGELVIVADGLPAAPAGEEYGCWVEIGGARTRIGRMFFAGDVAFWVGPVPGLASVPDGARFGVTLVPVGATTVDGQPVLEGTL